MLSNAGAARRWVVIAAALQAGIWACCADGPTGGPHFPELFSGGAGMPGPSAGTGGGAGAGAGSAGSGAGAGAGSGTGAAGTAGGPITPAAMDAGVGGAEAPAPDAGGADDGDDSADAAVDYDAGTVNADDPDGDGDPTWPPPPESEELRALPEDLAAGICGALDACLGPTLLEVTLDAAECEPRTAAELRDGEYVFLQASIDAGRVVFDPAKVAACAADYAALGCEVIASRAPASCKQMLEGQVAIGGACALDDDCEGGAFCSHEASCPGTCTALRAAGGDCDRNDQCQSGLQCLEGECAHDSGAGEDCDGGVAPPCHLGTLCVGDDPDMDEAGTCRTEAQLFTAGEGDECDVIGGTFCEDGLACVVDIVSQNVVTVCKPRVASGDDCHTSLLPQQCPAGEYCPADLNPDYQATCVPRPGAGEPCGAFDLCAPDHYCDGQLCKPFRLVQGQPCTLDGECLSQRCEPDEGGGTSHCVALDRCRLGGEPSCGDGACNGDETCESCAEDCDACPVSCGDGACNGDETCGSCGEDCGACPTCGDEACDPGETCQSCEEDCGVCAPRCGDDVCNGSETCVTCQGDCGDCPPVCGDDACDEGETCASCEGDCGACPAPYSGPCDADADCAPDQSCVQATVPGLLGLTPDVHYGYCSESCATVADCASSPSQRACTSAGDCALRCDVLGCLLDPSLCCPIGSECIDATCTWRR